MANILFISPDITTAFLLNMALMPISATVLASIPILFEKDLYLLLLIFALLSKLVFVKPGSKHVTFTPLSLSSFLKAREKLRTKLFVAE